MKPVLNKLFNFIASLKITVILLLLLAITFILGSSVGETLLSSKYSIIHNIVNFFELADIFHSWWFITILSLFSLNLLVCTLKRLPYTLKVLRPGREVFSEDLIDGRILKEEWKLGDFKPEFSEELKKTIGKYFNKPLIESDNQGLKHFTKKEKYSHLGFYLAHLGILVMVMGGIFNSFGYQGFVKIKKGEALDTFIFKYYPEILYKKLNFSIRCDDYKEIYYDHVAYNKVKDYQSTLTILKKGEEIKTATIDFSHPLKYQGVSIYQALSGQMFKKDSREKVLLSVAPQMDLRKRKRYQVSIGDSFKVEGTSHTIKVAEFTSNHLVENMDGTRKKVPAIKLILLDGDVNLYQGWIPAGSLNNESKRYSIYLSSNLIENCTYTRLNISRKPGEPLIWCGFIAMIIGFGISFFIPHRRIWLQVEEKEGIHHIILTGTTTKNLKSFEKDFRRLCQDLKRQYHLYDT